MHCSLLNLPTELLLKIIEELLRDEDTKTNANDGKNEDHDHKEKEDEPIKIYHDLINWSCTCSYFRTLLAPDIFKTVKLVNDEKSGSSLNAIAKGQHNVHVKQLHFVGSALGDAHRKEAAYSDIEGILPRSVEALLCNLQQFFSLESLIISSDYNFENPDEWSSGVEFLSEIETSDQVLKAEASAGWRAHMSRTYSALTKNKSHRLKYLEIRQFIWQNVSTFSHATFHDFLSRFEQFTLSVYGEIDSLGLMIIPINEYWVRVGKHDEYFFNHLANVTTFSIKAPEKGPLGLGLERTTYAPLNLKAEQMPLLTTLHLDYISASSKLIDFLVGHKDTLEELVLRNCYAVVDEDMHWSQLFNSLCSANPVKLSRFELVSRAVPVSCENRLIGQVEENKRLRTIMEEDPERIVLPYMTLNSWFRWLSYRTYETLHAFLKGEDQASWNRLMELVERNAKKATNNKSKGVE